jgi:hypothetical protein
LIHSARNGVPTHRDCANFRGGICAINGVAVDPNGSICPNFAPKGAMTTRPMAGVHSQARQKHDIYAPRIQSYPAYMQHYPSPTKYNSPSHAWYSYRTPHTVGPGPYTPVNDEGGNTLFLSMSRGSGGRGMRRGRMGGFIAGPGGSCVCPRCGYTTPHTTGTSCYQQTCPKCGSRMTREA